MLTACISHILLFAQAKADSTVAWKYSGIEGISMGNGIMITLVGMIVVFAALTIISFVIFLTGKAANFSRTQGVKQDAADVAITARPVGLPGEVVAAISLALQAHLFEIHDDEKTVVTIKKISRPYSPWSSKLHMMTRPPYPIISKR